MMEEKEQKNQNQNQKKQRHRCVHCNSTLCYFKVKTNQWQCRSCGYVEGIGEEE